MSSVCLLLTTVLLLQASHACDNNLAAVRDDSAEYLANVYGSRQLWGPYYQPSSQVPGNILFYSLLVNC